MKINIKGNPISINSMYRGGRRFLTDTGKAVKMANAIEARNQYKGKPLQGHLVVTIHFTFSDKRRHDIDNCIKALLDSLTGILWKDDDQIIDMHVYKLFDKSPSIELEVWEVGMPR